MLAIKYRKIFLTISALIVIASLSMIFGFGFRYSIDFTGGSLTEIRYTDSKPTIPEVESSLAGAGFQGSSIRDTDELGYIIRTKDISQSDLQRFENALSLGGKSPYEQQRFTSIGPIVGEELRTKAWIAILFIIIITVFYIAFVFRKVGDGGRLKSGPSSWTYGLTAIVALIHDIVVPAGLFALLGYLHGVEVDALFVTALLALLGYSINDTIIIFDRIRENLLQNSKLNLKESFDMVVGRSLSETYGRSINTALTTLFVLFAILFLGGDSTFYFILTLSVGVIAGVYSSIFIAAPLLVFAEKLKNSSK